VHYLRVLRELRGKKVRVLLVNIRLRNRGKLNHEVAQNPWWKHGAEFAPFDKNFREAILLVEQNARMALEYSDRGYVFEIGKIAFQDEAKNLLEEVRKSFLGER
jgi:hypothetical protein